MNRRGREDGQTLVEFALTSVLFLTITMFLLDGTRMLWNQVTLDGAAAVGARYASTHGSNSASPQGTSAGTYDNLKQQVRNKGYGLSSSLQITATWEDNSNIAGQVVTVTLNYPTKPVVGLFWRGRQFNLRAAASAVIQN